MHCSKKQKKEKGFLTIDFIFSFTAMFGIATVFALLSLTFVATEVSQYIIFSVNRTHISGHLSKADQEDMAQKKYNQVLSRFGKMFSSGDQSWFKLELSNLNSGQNFSSPEASAQRQQKYGYSLRMTSNILKNFRIPLLGNASSSSDFGSLLLKAYLYREPSTEECLNFNKSRWKELQQAYPDIQALIGGSSSEDYGSQADNGC